jgi:hypothetical protein
MSWQYALVGEQVGLQYVGSHPRASSSLPQLFVDVCRHSIGQMQPQLDTAMHHQASYGVTFGPWASDILDPAHSMFFPRRLVIRLSQWTDHASAAETDARKFTRALFRFRKELDAIPRRFVDQEDNLREPVAADFKAWADGVITAWGGTPSTDPRILGALATILNGRCG